MDENGEQRVGAERLGDKVDRLSNLPESLLLEVLFNLPTKDVVRCSVLSSRWRNIWQLVPGLDLDMEDCDFGEYDEFVSFVDRFLGFNSESCIQQFQLQFYWYKNDKPDITHLTRWINTVVERKVQHLLVSDSRCRDDELQIPPSVYKCESLVSLDLYYVILANPEFVFLPSVKVIYLYMVQFPKDFAFEMLISGCPVLESLTINSNCVNNVLRVCSHSLLRFTYYDGHYHFVKDVLVDAPKLEYLELRGFATASFIISNSPSLVKVIVFTTHQFGMDDPQKRNMIHNLLVGISSVKDMVISSHNLEVIYNYSRYETLPLFRNLSFLDVCYNNLKWGMLLSFLGRCPNLKSLVMVSPKGDVIGSLPRPQCFLTSLEFVKIYSLEVKLVSYFLKNSAILKKLTLCSNDHRKEILKELLTIPRLSASCQVVVL